MPIHADPTTDFTIGDGARTFMACVFQGIFSFSETRRNILGVGQQSVCTSPCAIFADLFARKGEKESKVHIKGQ